MRELLIATPSEKTIFVRENAGNAHNHASMGQKIIQMFTRWAGVPISPHDLRHLYRTFIDNPDTGATKEERESAAYWMRHSDEAAKRIYSHLNNEQKLRAGAQLLGRLNKQLLGNG